MPKIFYTERDIDDMKARGVTSLDVTDNIIVTDLGIERAMKHGIKLNRIEHRSAPLQFSPSVNTYAAYPREPNSADAELKERIKSAVLSRLNGQVDATLLDAVITRVLAGMK